LVGKLYLELAYPMEIRRHQSFYLLYTFMSCEWVI